MTEKEIINAINLSDETLTIAYVFLFDKDWKRDWSIKSKANEMRTIIRGGDMPCRPFAKWAKCIKFIDNSVLTKNILSSD